MHLDSKGVFAFDEAKENLVAIAYFYQFADFRASDIPKMMDFFFREESVSINNFSQVMLH
ncbi:MAG: hypothetical protein SOV58_02250 [Candidatus Enteromonas sp.]|nr:hypothetical protein [Candidatus Enteromonas sp.]